MHPEQRSCCVDKFAGQDRQARVTTCRPPFLVTLMQLYRKIYKKTMKKRSFRFHENYAIVNSVTL